MSQDKCPVDHTQRAAWMEKMAQPAETATEKCPVDHSARAKWLSSVSVTAQAPEAIETPTEGCDSAKLAQEPVYSTSAPLPTEREISSIPRTDTRSHWVYPSQKQFYEAMKRKNWNPEAADMQTVVPIHNQVNELAWRHIMFWEQAHLAAAEQKCGGISLTSFKGDSKKLTPRAWFRSAVLGEEKPFDRHDWVVDRCGVEVPYVIDFYSSGEKGVTVDVRPKLSSWEGVKLRVGRALGWA
ncbi:Cytochrome c/c1 heme lyase family protein [Clavispora lusitaniae]|uniref:Cytochrome c/c1 heme lyase family protein n=1 Tax=Clavispora lusitaniae TaxID=36911 RepID=UPI00202C9A9B|nr:Cytochrome c/c1 heme lyase family protein [Clavispora lusitaniae]